MSGTPPVDVLVVGGGPVGVTSALLLAHRGLSVRVLERAPEVYDLPRAIVMDDEIQRVFQNVGLQDRLRAITTPLAGGEFVRPDGEFIIGAELPLDADWPLGHHPSVCYYQPELEAFLRAAAVEVGVELALGVNVSSVEQDEQQVVVRGSGPGGVPHEHVSSWVIGADGASSAIRKSFGVPFVDQGFDQDWLVLDVQLTRPVPTLPRFVQQICDPARPVTFVPGHADYRRWEFQLQPGEDRDEMVAPETIWPLVQPWITPEDARLVRAVVYRFHATVADRMRVGRVLLAGDAAHQMPPFLGQGLCSGVRDAANLAWKLAMVSQQQAATDLLDTYGDERLPHAGVVAHAVDTGRLIDQLAGRPAEDTDLDAAYGGGRGFPRLEHGVVLTDHPLAGRQLLQPTVDGQPLDELLGDGFAVLIRRAADCPAAVANRWASIGGRVVEVPEGVLDAVLPPEGAVVVRPDRYVAAIADRTRDLGSITDALLARLCVVEAPA